MAVAHIALDLLLRHKCCNRVDDNDVDRAGPHHRLRDLKRLVTAVRLRYVQFIDIHPDILRIYRVHGMLSIDKTGDAASLLYFGDHVERHCCLTAGFRSVYLDDTSLWNSAQSQRKIKA